MGKRESKFQSDLIAEIKELYPESIVLKTNPNYIQGFPDLIVLYFDTWAALECKRKVGAHYQANQPYWIERLGRMSYAASIYPENKEDILGELQQAFGPRR